MIGYLLSVQIKGSGTCFDKLVYGKDLYEATKKIHDYMFEKYPNNEYVIQNNTIE
jgi:hypothetical protein